MLEDFSLFESCSSYPKDVFVGSNMGVCDLAELISIGFVTDGAGLWCLVI